MTEDAVVFQKLFFDNYRAITSTPFSVYPRRMFYTMGMPLPRQFYAYYKLAKKGFGNDEKFLSSELILVKTTTDNIVIIDNYYDQVFKEIVDGNESVEKKYRLILTSGYFYRGSNPSRRSKMIKFLKDLAKKGVELCIHTQDEKLENDFFDSPNEKEALLPYVHIKWTCYRIDIHYIILQDLKNIEESHFFLEYPHSEHHICRLDIHFTYKEIKEKFNGDPKKVFNYLLNIRKGKVMEKFSYYFLKYFPFLRKCTPYWGIAFR
jgi:hypothetical protein